MAVTRDEKLLIRYVIETEPDLFTDLASYWLFQKFYGESSASNYTSEDTSYSEVLCFTLEMLEQDANLALYSDTLFLKWLNFLTKIPDLKSTAIKKRIEQHFVAILDKIQTTNLKLLFERLVSQFLIKRVGIRQELQRFTVDYIQSILVGQLFDKYKSVALFQLLFQEGSGAPSAASRAFQSASGPASTRL